MDTTETNLPLEDLQRIIDFLKEAISIYDDVFETLEKNDGWLPLNSNVIDFLSKLEVPWCTFYEDKDVLKGLAYHSCFGNEEVDQPSLNKFLEESTNFLSQSDADLNLLKDEIEQANGQKDELSVEEQQVGLQFIYVLITHFFNILALMVHRRSMCKLVADAKNGDDEAFCLAVQIDRTVLQLPYFQQRLLKSQFSNHAVFLNKLASRLRTPISQSKIRYRTLILTFAMLDDMDILDTLSLEELLDICEEIGVTGKENGIDDVDKLRKRLHEYKKNVRN